ncbi:hypothetical protein NDU88_001886 [Pleurodeles waltl]|uniref:Uncharacterized protein n=1 Tax=Pleurodeles waltl TaxID=8319 RepID=A0AAV7T0F1_PLEWA|nr:hypothetical protein NDU88_001886 [Pleurodeles waltl]
MARPWERRRPGNQTAPEAETALRLRPPNEYQPQPAGPDRGCRSRTRGRCAIQRAQEGGPTGDRTRGRRRREWATPEQTGPGIDRGPVVRQTRHREHGYRCTDPGSTTSEGRRHRGTCAGDPRPLSPGRRTTKWWTTGPVARNPGPAGP